ncbi:MAG: YdeI/OmpD-associated family protein [Alphaproteobacteria bacterium]|nr:YdeI/OmpD-associated family protein [Alphaproteobacteria bacterium]MBU0866413.1 YdeI/OmpD-associated family protein [Alphaproteobacteria bacterium]MBU1825542.1 YdeI/OmpD-associated family protein [Alphaproteobacteria bacterium]
MKFTVRIELRGINPYVMVSDAQAQQIRPDWKRPIPVTVQVNGQPEPPARVNMMPAGDGSFLLYLDGTIRKASATAVGDTVEVSLAFDDSYRGGPAHAMPSEFAARLDANPVARARWDQLSPSLQKEMLRYFARLKSDDARTRNIEQALNVLNGTRDRFMARTWN